MFILSILTFIFLAALLYFFFVKKKKIEEKQEEAYEEGKEIPPPWVRFPGYPPYDGFWRQPGDPWLSYVWRPYWEKLNEEEKKEYLDRWNVPEEWWEYSHDINPDTDFWKAIDEADEPG